MPELGEMVAVVTGSDAKCPFDHRPGKHNKKNVVPPPDTKNNSKTLGTALDAESKKVEDLPIGFQSRNIKYSEAVKFTPHHLIPGNESWPNSQLYKWVDKRKSHVCGDVGYDVNAAMNGVDLPGNSAASSWVDPGFQTRYALHAMVADKKKRQFHDRHPAYSDFVVNALNKIATKLDAKEIPGCGKKNCGGAKKKPFDPPYGLLTRIEGVAHRLEVRLSGDARRWKKPIMTSRFAMIFKNRGMSQDEARRELQTSQFDYGN